VTAIRDGWENQMVKYICNAFSLNMLASVPASVKVEEVTPEQARSLAEGAESAVGHADTAAVMSSVLGMSVPMNRTTVALAAGDSVVVGQYKGPRLEEGTTVLPAGATIQWLLVTVE